ncbi:ADP-ribosylglycohydrolase family protein [Chloroflexota bacterium]
MKGLILKSKFLGSLVGAAVGDAVGAAFEGSYVVNIEDIQTTVEGQNVLAYTDDTHMMIGVAESLIRNKGFNGEGMANTFVQNYELEPFRGYGPGPPSIFQMVRDGEAWDKAAQKLYHGGSYGNGSAMRIAPVGVLYHDDLETAREIAYKSSLITHAHILGKEGAALQAYAIALVTGLQPQALNRSNFIEKIRNYAEDDVYRQKIIKIEELLDSGDRIRVAREIGNGIEAFNSVPTAIYSFLVCPDSFTEAVLYAVSLGGDTDTIGAMTGAISGAYLGIESIPASWRDKLENKLYIEQLAEKLWSLHVEHGKSVKNEHQPNT